MATANIAIAHRIGHLFLFINTPSTSDFARSRRVGKPEPLLPLPQHFIVRFAGGCIQPAAPDLKPFSSVKTDRPHILLIHVQAQRAAEMTQHKQITGHAGGGFTVRQTGSCRFLFHANIHWAYYKISSAGYRVPFAFFQFDFF